MKHEPLVYFLLGAHFEGADLSGAQFNGAQINDLYVDEKTIVDSRTMFVGVSCNKETTDRLASFFWRCEEAKKWMHPD